MIFHSSKFRIFLSLLVFKIPFSTSWSYWNWTWCEYDTNLSSSPQNVLYPVVSPKCFSKSATCSLPVEQLFSQHEKNCVNLEKNTVINTFATMMQQHSNQQCTRYPVRNEEKSHPVMILHKVFCPGFVY